jgi:hypothetical protein
MDTEPLLHWRPLRTRSMSPLRQGTKTQPHHTLHHALTHLIQKVEQGVVPVGDCGDEVSKGETDGW